MWKFLSCLFVATFLVACNTVPAVETANQRLVVVEHSYTAVLKTIDAGIDAGLIKGSHAKFLWNKMNELELSVNIARQAVKANSFNALELLDVSMGIIAEVVKYLQALEK